MSDIPREVLSEHFQERLSGRRLVGALFFTFEFDAGFFEQEILPVILDTPVSHAQVPRLLQLEDALRGIPNGVAVFYDWTSLRTSDYVAPRLDVHRLPVRLTTGIFHPKNVLLLTEDADADDEGVRRRRLIVATLSANLTRSGWWENVEACHVEEIEEGASTRLKEPLLTLLQRVERLTANPVAGELLAPYRRFLGTVQHGSFKSAGRWLHPHLYVGGAGQSEDVTAFLRANIPRDQGYRLEVISPYFDKHPSSSPVRALIEAFQPEEVHIYLPQDVTGVAQCSEELFEYVREFGPHVGWGTFDDKITALGRNADANRRSVHAKVYRVFKPHPKAEYRFVGSVNLTAPAHSGRGGNLETGVLVELDPPSRPDFWLQALKRKPAVFHTVPPEDEVDEGGALPVQIRFSWKTREARVRWDGAAASVELTLCGTGGALGPTVMVTRKEWVTVSQETAEALAGELISTSIIRVRTDDGRESRVLVQEEDMPLKPELLRTLPVRDILQYWSLLKPEQRQAFLDSRAQHLSPGELGSLLIPFDDGVQLGNDIFERCAGIFHAFAQLESRIYEALEERRPGQAAALLFGERFDSLPTVVERVLKGEDVTMAAEAISDTDRYLVLLCSVQLCDGIQQRHPAFWSEYKTHADAVFSQLRQRSELREALCAQAPPEMPAFMDWFDKWFLKRTRPVRQV